MQHSCEVRRRNEFRCHDDSPTRGRKHANLILHLLSLLFAHPTEFHGVTTHAQLHALLQSTVLTAISVHPEKGLFYLGKGGFQEERSSPIHCTVLLPRTLIIRDRRLTPSKEALEGGNCDQFGNRVGRRIGELEECSAVTEANKEWS